MTTWTLALQMQFWSLFPLLLLETRCWEFAGYDCGCAGISSMAGTPVTSKFARYTDIVEQQQVHKSQLWKKMPIQTFHPHDAESLELLIFLGRHDYFSSCTRVAPICFGALAALCVLDSAWVQKMARHSRRLHTLWICLILSNFIGFFVNKNGPQVDPNHIMADPVNLAFAFIGIRGVLSPVLPALTLALITNKRMGETSMVARAFSLPVFQWLAGITYDIFLTHPLVLLCVWYILPPSVWFAPDRPYTFALVTCISFSLSAAFAWLHNRAWSNLMEMIRSKSNDVPSCIN
ncbi:hypothetical protein COCSUDRAFT_45501 [Coccomyxa subellipsoidea C-169]|uniref:Uncharacterized protein n=1 Tax=Coccomyxa subellipsoidea (strain C-169) TaxID=574566 RepID=I0YIM0_COCSC|nr:hypothetical protein COCSUDRAFT_45501 [Coccomyxa subellipsoidea C-169]EIE18239.1 hypothetical protein COCSUDRAFT_45501 [Coccomyxa subellipsoidea C-169]|eukprot:XP_005642783.1 hypothetical protein COCSUDRAFT_45501 [Coccomyxa subellipsoidea C-169]